MTFWVVVLFLAFPPPGETVELPDRYPTRAACEATIHPGVRPAGYEGLWSARCRAVVVH